VYRRTTEGLVTFFLWEIQANVAVLVDGGPIRGVNEIPFAELRTSGSKGVLLSDPPLYDLAEMNRAHYNADSDYQNAIHLSCSPIWTEVGVTNEDQGGPIILGPTMARRSSNKDATFAYVEPSGTSLEVSRKNLTDKVTAMAAMGNAAVATT